MQKPPNSKIVNQICSDGTKGKETIKEGMLNSGALTMHGPYMQRSCKELANFVGPYNYTVQNSCMVTYIDPYYFVRNINFIGLCIRKVSYIDILHNSPNSCMVTGTHFHGLSLDIE